MDSLAGSHGIHVVDLQHDDPLKKVSVRDLYKSTSPMNGMYGDYGY